MLKMNSFVGDHMEVDSVSPSKKSSKKPKYSRFTQQELPAYKPILTPVWVISMFITVGIIFIPIGLVSLSASENVVEVVREYETDCIPPSKRNDKLSYIKDPTTNKTCSLRMTIPKQMRSPIYIYYQLEDFYQNHRRYVKSRNDKQLRNKASEQLTKGCEPEAIIGTDRAPIVPCGLIAWSLFNDTYAFSVDSNSLQVNKNGIAWESDRKHKFGSDVYPKNFQIGDLIGGGTLNSSIPLNEQEDLIVWMRTAALPTFRKLYGKIEHDLEANQELSVVVENNYNTYSFGGKKKLVLSTTSWIGGKNEFLGVGYLSIGGLSLTIAVAYTLLYIIKPRAIGDPNYLSWNRNPAGILY
ncbi:unnamed protein product [Amaranthus hypochondriacus]